MTDQEYNQIVVGFVRKRDGELVTVKLVELFKQVLKADFLNNEINLNGEVCVLDSFRRVETNVKLSLRMNFQGGSGFIRVNGVNYNNDCSIQFKTGASVNINVVASTGVIRSITDEYGVLITNDHGEFIHKMEMDFCVVVLFTA